MGTFVVYMLKSTLYLSAFYLFYKLLLSRDTYFRLNRIALIFSILLSCSLPFVGITTASVALTDSPVSQMEQHIQMATQVAERPIASNWWSALVLIYWVGMFVFLIIHFVLMFRLFLLLCACRELRAEEDCTILTHRFQLSPFSWMHYIVISENDLEENPLIYLEHEKAHIRAGHTFDILLVTIMTIFQWFNPIVWLLKLELHNIHEYEADNTVLRQGIDGRTYQLLLLRKAAGEYLYSQVNSFNHSLVDGRIRMMLKKRTHPLARLKIIFVLPVAVLVSEAFARPEAIALTSGLESVSLSDYTENILEDGYLRRSVMLSDNQVKPEFTPKDMVLSGIGNSGKEMAQINGIMANRNFPEYPGGARNLWLYLKTFLRYPEEAFWNLTEGQVVVKFTVLENGTIESPEIASSVSPELDEEALRLINKMPRWLPAMKEGKPVRSTTTVPVTFLLQ